MPFDRSEAERWFGELSSRLPQVTINYQLNDMLALVGSSTFVIYDIDAGGNIEVQSADFIIQRLETIDRPERGDIITTTDEWNNVCTYEVIDPVYRWLEPTKSLIRIHTKQIDNIQP